MWRQNSPSFISPPPNATTNERWQLWRTVQGRITIKTSSWDSLSSSPTRRAGRSCSAHSTGTDRTRTCVGHVQATGPGQKSARPPSQSAASADGCPRMLFTVGSVSSPSPFYHLIVTFWFPRSCWQTSFLWGNACYLTVPQPASPIQRHRMQAPRRDGDRSSSTWLSLHWGDKEMWDTGGQLQHTKALKLAAASPLRFPLKTGDKLKLFQPKVPLYVNKSWCPHLIGRRLQEKGAFLLYASRKEGWGNSIRTGFLMFTGFERMCTQS